MSESPVQDRLIGWRQVLYAAAVLTAAWFAFGSDLKPANHPPAKYVHSHHDTANLPYLGLLVISFWFIVRASRRRANFLFTAVAIIVFMFSVMLILLPAVQQAREAARRTQCRNNLKQIGLALHNYHDAYGTFPPAYIADENGRRTHSWRVLILPFLDGSNLYYKYRFDEPWDSPENQRLAERMPYVYRCPSHFGHIGWNQPSSMTSYHAIVGTETIWPGATAISIDEIGDGTSNTVAVIEFDDREVNWMQPVDVTVNETEALFREPRFYSDFAHAGGFYALFADGSGRFIELATSPEYWRSLLTRSGDVTLSEDAAVPEDRRRRWEAHQVHPLSDIIRVFARIAFVILAFLPFLWHRLQPWLDRYGRRWFAIAMVDRR